MMNNSRSSHPAIEAWLALDENNQVPKKAIALYALHKEKRNKCKSSVYKLFGVDEVGSNIVAKRCHSETAKLERLIYERILPKLPVSSLRYYGFAEDDDFCWLFIEFTSGVEWNLKDKDHLELAIHWLATMHGHSANIDEISLLPERGLQQYRTQLNEAASRAQAAVLNSTLNPEQINVMDDLRACSVLLEPLWPIFQSFCRSMPSSLVHNDFIKKNVHVRNINSKLTLLPFDWEMSGRGLPSVDLYWLHQMTPSGSIKLYWEYLREYHENINLHDIENLVKMGYLFRCIQSLEWASHSFSYKSYKRIRNAKKYIGGITNIINSL